MRIGLSARVAAGGEIVRWRMLGIVRNGRAMDYATTYYCATLPDPFRLPARIQIAAHFGRFLESEGLMVTEALVSPRALKRLEDAWTPLASGTERIAKAQAAGDPSRFKPRQEELLRLFRGLRALAVSIDRGMAGHFRRPEDAPALISALGSSPTFDRLYLGRVLVGGLLRESHKLYPKTLVLLSLTRGQRSPILARIVDELAADAVLSPAVLAGVTKAERNVRDQLDPLLALLSGADETPQRDPLWKLLAERLGAGSPQLRRAIEHRFVAKLRGRDPFCDTPDAALLRLDEFVPRLLAGAFSREMAPRIAVALVDRYCFTQNQGGAGGRRMALQRLSSIGPDLYARFLRDLSAAYGQSSGQLDVLDAARAFGLDMAEFPGVAA